MALPLKPKRLVPGAIAHYTPIKNRNLIKWSEDFSNAVWGKNNITVTQNNAISPNGSLTATLIVPTTSTNAKTLDTTSFLPASHYKSIYCKTSGYRYIQINWGSGFSLAYANFDIIDGIVTLQSGCIAKIVDVGNGWFRISTNVTSNSVTTAHGYTIISASNSTRGSSMTGDGTSGIYIWGAQLELSTSATTYQRTSDLQTLWNQKQENMSVTNIVTNGNFPSTSGWSFNDSIGSVVNNEASFIGSAQYANILQSISSIVGNKYYIRATVKSSVTNARLISVNLGVAGVNHDGSNLYKNLSAVGTATNNTFNLAIQDTRTSGWDLVFVKKFIAINLTSLFGAGNEPTQQQCDEMFSSWFDGSIRMNLNRYNGMLGSTSAVDVNDPTYDGTGLSFGGDDYVNVGNIGKEMRTLQMVFYTPSVINKDSVSQCLLSTGQSNDGSLFTGSATGLLTNEIIIISSGTTASDGRSGWCDATANISIGWHILDVVWDGSKYIFILDGIKKTTTTANTPIVLACPNLKIGTNFLNATYFNGKQAEILLYERSLADAELAQNRAYFRQECARLGVTLP